MSSETFLSEHLILRKLIRKRRHKTYIRDIFKNRLNQGDMQLLQELQFDEEYHHKYLRMNKENFDWLMQRIKYKIAHPTNHRYPICAKTRLAITLRYLATGASQISLGLAFGVSPSVVSKIIPETLRAICEEFQDEYLSHPTPETWQEIAAGFREKWNFPNCCDALDGKHVRVRSFSKVGSKNYNYKKYFSLVLMASVDASYKFNVVVIGARGSESDSGILERSDFGSQLYAATLPLPPPTKVATGEGSTQTEVNIPHVFIGEQGFQLRVNLMIPYSLNVMTTEEELIFNYRLSRARRVVENAFGILAARWRIFHTPINSKEETVRLIIQATVILHNFLTSKSDRCVVITHDREENGSVVPGSWREVTENDRGMIGGVRVGSNNYGTRARIIRDTFKNYYNSAHGSVPWQLDIVSRGLRTT